MQYSRICKIILLLKQFLWAQDAIYVRFCHDFPIFLNKAKTVCLDFYKNLPKHHSNLNFSRIIIFKLFSLPYINILETKSEFFFINYVTVSQSISVKKYSICLKKRDSEESLKTMKNPVQSEIIVFISQFGRSSVQLNMIRSITRIIFF